MFIQGLVLVSVIAAAAAPLPPQTLVSNGSFTSSGKRSGDGSIPPDQLPGWRVAYGTPKIISEAGCEGDPGYITLSGNKAEGAALWQPISLRKGVRYTVALCARYRPSKIPNALVVLRASTALLDKPPAPSKVTHEETIGEQSITKTDWQDFGFEFVASRDAMYLTIGVSNDDAASLSWADIDKISITVADVEVAPLFNEDVPGAIPGEYIVVLKSDTSPAVVKELKEFLLARKVEILSQYDSGILGFAVRCTKSTLEEIRRKESVLWIEANQKITSTSQTQTAPPRGIDRIDQRLLPVDNAFQYSETGRGVHVYVFDTGIRTTHKEFVDGRASGAYTAIDDKYGTDDCHGHGTHVAATIGGAKYGVAKNVSLHAVRVIDCRDEGTLIGVTKAVEWLTNHCILPAVANLSIIASAPSDALGLEIKKSIAKGVTYVVAAGNRADDACKYSPAAVPEAITVGATTSTAKNPLHDTRFILSNYGPCLDLFAPGAGILSAWIGPPPEDTKVLSGASMAAAHVAGVAALVLELNPQATPADVWNTIHANNIVASTPGWSGVFSRGTNSPNELLHWRPSMTDPVTGIRTRSP